MARRRPFAQKVFERSKQIRNAVVLFPKNYLEISALRQQRKESLRQVLGLFSSGALSPDKTMNAFPVAATAVLGFISVSAQPLKKNP